MANAGMVLYNGLIADGVDWRAVKYAAVTQALYIVITFARDASDPTIPNKLD